MATNNWLFKEEPSSYSYDALVKDRKATWSGVKNPLAQKHLRAIRRGDGFALRLVQPFEVRRFLHEQLISAEFIEGKRIDAQSASERGLRNGCALAAAQLQFCVTNKRRPSGPHRRIWGCWLGTDLMRSWRR